MEVLKLSKDELSKLQNDTKGAENNPAEYFAKIRNNSNDDELSEIYGYILSTSNNFPLLAQTIKEIDKLRHPKNIDDLIDFLMTKTFTEQNANDIINLKIICIKAVSNYKSTKCIPALLYCLNDKRGNYKIRFQAAEALGKIGDKNAVDSLINVVIDEEEKSVYVRESAAAALGMIGDMRAIDPFLSILEAKKNFLGKFTFLKERITEALTRMNFNTSKRAVSAFKNALDDDSAQVRINAIECLMNTDSEEAYELIKTKLKDNDDEVVKNAVIAMYNLKGKEALFEILKDDSSSNFAIDTANEIYLEYEEHPEKEDNV